MFANLASLGHACERRRSSAETEVGLHDIVREAFDKVDLNGDGKLSPPEIAESLKSLLELQDPVNDADSICAAIDTDGDGFISLSEFHGFIRPTVGQHLAAGRQLEVERILRDAFSRVLTDAKSEREDIIRAFMESEKTISSTTKQASGNVFSHSWMHKIFEGMYNNPADDPNAPIYRAHRAEYLKEQLKTLIAKEEQALEIKPKKNFSPWERQRRGSSGDVSQAEAKRLAFRKSIDAPDSDKSVVKSFASLWLEKIEAHQVERAGTHSLQG